MHMVIEGNYGPVSPDPKTRGRGMVIVSNSYYTHQQENYRGLPKHFFYKCTLSGKQFQIKIVGDQRKSYIILHARQTSMGMKHVSDKMFLQKDS